MDLFIPFKSFFFKSSFFFYSALEIVIKTRLCLMKKRIGYFMKYTNFPCSVIYASCNIDNTRGWGAQNLLHQYVVLLKRSLCEKMQQKTGWGFWRQCLVSVSGLTYDLTLKWCCGDLRILYANTVSTYCAISSCLWTGKKKLLTS